MPGKAPVPNLPTPKPRKNGEDHFLGGPIDPQYPVIPKFIPVHSEILGKAWQGLAETRFIIVKGEIIGCIPGGGQMQRILNGCNVFITVPMA